MPNFSARIARRPPRATRTARPSAMSGPGGVGDDDLRGARSSDRPVAALARADGRRRRAATASPSSAPTTPRWIAAYLGVLRIGAVAVPLDTATQRRRSARSSTTAGARHVRDATPWRAVAPRRPRGAGRPSASGTADGRRRHRTRPGPATVHASTPDARGGDPLHVGHDGRSEGRRAHPRQPRRRARRRRSPSST